MAIVRTLLVLLACLMPSLAAAQTAAVCRTGQGCRCLDLSRTGAFPGLAAASDLIGDVRPDERLVLDRSTNTTFRTRRNASDIHRSFGGGGDCPTSEPPAEIVPLDGTWQWRTLGESSRGCPPMMTQMIASARTETLATRLVWDGRFDPQRLAASLPTPEVGDMSIYTWRELGLNRFLSDNIRDRTCEDGTCVDVALRLWMSLVAPERITGLLDLRSRVEAPDGTASILAGYGMLDCRVRVRYEIVRIGG